jgi:hypothetical protein
MSYEAQIVVENAELSFGRSSMAAIGPHHAVEAARILLARSPTHARRFARAMHRRVSAGLDWEIIEHWARVVTEVGRTMEAQPSAR